MTIKRVPYVSNMLDEYTRVWVMMYFMPFFIIGNGDKMKEIGNLCRPF